MATRSEKDKQKQLQEKHQAILNQMLRDEDNKYCVDCDAKGPRWASWNLGVFLCIRCAGIHRNLGVHISKVKSVNLDSWTPEQIQCMQQMGNSRARAVYEANLPDNFRRPQSDSSLEAFIRSKYEQKKYIAKEWVPPPLPKPQPVEEEKKEKKRPRPRPTATIDIQKKIPPVQQTSNLPPLPKIISSNSVSNNQNVSKSQQNSPEVKASASVDLLGLEDPGSGAKSNDDPFGVFLSANSQKSSSPNVQSNSTADQNSSSEEASFFSETSTTGQSDSQQKPALSKESILSLYGSASSQAQPAFGVPGGMYLPQTQQNFGLNFGISATPIGGPVPGMMPAAMQNGLLGTFSTPSVMPTNPMMANSMMNNIQPGMLGGPPMMGGIGMFAQSNPQIPQLQQVQQQLGNLNLSGSSMGWIPPAQQQQTTLMSTNSGWGAPSSGQTLSTNLWQ